MKNKAPATSAELLDRVKESFDRALPETAEEAAEELCAAGFDPDIVAHEMERVARDLLARSPRNWRVRAQAERAQALAAFDRARAVTTQIPADLKAEINAILARAPHLQSAPQVRAHFHKLEGRASQSDLEALLAELRFLERLHSDIGKKQGEE
jgi:hypothetical protein